MIRIIFRGGLGNQMFQYAAGYQLAKRHNTGLILDTSWYHWQRIREFELDTFSINGDRIDSRLQGAYQLLTNRPLLSPCKRRRIIPQNKQQCYDEFVKAGPESILHGWFISDRYFSDVAIDIRKVYNLKTIGLPTKSYDILDNINGTESVCVHVRLGDYLKYPQLDLCRPLYYANAIRFMRERLSAPVFFIFSDNIDFCKSVIEGDDLIYCTGNPQKNPFVDLRLMSACKHHVVANSTFSWWGAWLSQSPSQIVTTPDVWIAGNVDTSDYCPRHWNRIPIAK